MIKVTLMGRLVDDPELRTVEVNGEDVSVLNVTVATRRNRKDEDGNYIADFIPVTFWRGAAEVVAQYATKGTLMSISGSLETRRYEDDRYTDDEGNAVTRRTFTVVADDFHFWGGGQQAEGNEEEAAEEVVEEEKPAPKKGKVTPISKAPAKPAKPAPKATSKASTKAAPAKAASTTSKVAKARSARPW